MRTPAQPATQKPTTDIEPRDDFDDLLDESMEDPRFREAYEDALSRAELVKCLVRCRVAHKLTQKEVAARMETTQSAVSDFERGNGDYYYSTLQRYARAVTAKVVSRVDMPHDSSWTGPAYVRPADPFGVSPVRRVRDNEESDLDWRAQARRMQSAHSR